MAHQIDLFCVPQMADTGCLEADHRGGSVSVLPDFRLSLRVMLAIDLA
jgi:hypothetical protein